jgi:hypothetical protein
MPGGSLTPTQARLIELLADMTPPWTLTGGAALIGFYTGHRTTRDLDLRWPGSANVADGAQAVTDRLRRARLDFDVLQSGPTFERIRVVDGDDIVLIDLVADPVPSIDEPNVLALGAVHLRVDTPHEILVNKLCALLGRMELRDLQDIRELLAAGGDLNQAVLDAPRKDGGFSPLTLSWVLQGMPADRLAAAAGWTDEDGAAIEQFKLTLIDRMLRSAAPQ